MASNMTKYATAKAHVCSNALTACCMMLGLNLAREAPAMPEVALSVVSGCLFVAAPFEDEAEEEVFVAETSVLLYCVTRKRSYSFAARRRNSRRTTSRITPIHEPANMALDLTCHDDEMKHVSMTFQFHSIYVAKVSILWCIACINRE